MNPGCVLVSEWRQNGGRRAAQKKRTRARAASTSPSSTAAQRLAVRRSNNSMFKRQCVSLQTHTTKTRQTKNLFMQKNLRNHKHTHTGAHAQHSKWLNFHLSKQSSMKKEALLQCAAARGVKERNGTRGASGREACVIVITT